MKYINGSVFPISQSSCRKQAVHSNRVTEENLMKRARLNKSTRKGLKAHCHPMPEGKYGDGFQKLRENPCWRGQQMDTMALGRWPQQTWDNTAGAEEEFSLTIPHPHISLTIATNPLAPLPCICKVQSKKQEAHWGISKRPGSQAQNRVGKGEEGWGGVVQIKHTHWHYFVVCLFFTIY